jgi:hypothetical protein
LQQTPYRGRREQKKSVYSCIDDRWRASNYSLLERIYDLVFGFSFPLEATTQALL